MICDWLCCLSAGDAGSILLPPAALACVGGQVLRQTQQAVA